MRATIASGLSVRVSWGGRDAEARIDFCRIRGSNFRPCPACWGSDQHDGLRGRSTFGGSVGNPGWQDRGRCSVSLWCGSADRAFTGRRSCAVEKAVATVEGTLAPFEEETATVVLALDTED